VADRHCGIPRCALRPRLLRHLPASPEHQPPDQKYSELNIINNARSCLGASNYPLPPTAGYTGDHLRVSVATGPGFDVCKPGRRFSQATLSRRAAVADPQPRSANLPSPQTRLVSFLTGRVMGTNGHKSGTNLTVRDGTPRYVLARIDLFVRHRKRRNPWSAGPFEALTRGFLLGTPNGIRTRAATLRGWCPRPLDDGGLLACQLRPDGRMVRGGGLEPPKAAPEAAVLPITPPPSGQATTLGHRRTGAKARSRRPATSPGTWGSGAPRRRLRPRWHRRSPC
jgi:hypothetical protein